MIDKKLKQVVEQDVARALQEDLGAGDLTAHLIDEQTQADALIISRQIAVICGIPWADLVFRKLNADIEIDWLVEEGQTVQPDQELVRIAGKARTILSGERTALNFLQTLSGTATRSHQYAQIVLGTDTRILDTRKTIPGLRLAQKYAVACGGCKNHRMGLFDGILIKENHILAAGSITRAIDSARTASADVPVEVEVENLNEVQEALTAGADILLLDNFSLDQLREAVALNRGKAKLEASGGLTLDDIRSVAETGVDYISVGALTKDLISVDLSMRFTAR